MIDIRVVDASIDKGIAVASKWEKESNILQARKVFAWRLGDMLTVSTMGYTSQEEAKEYLINRGASALFLKVITMSEHLYREIKGEKAKYGYIGESFHHISLVALGWLLDHDELSKKMLDIAEDIVDKKSKLLFSQITVCCMHCFVNHKVYCDESGMKFTGLQKHVVLYHKLMEELILGKDIEDTIKLIDYNFQKRQQDGRLVEGIPVTLGTKENPVRWEWH